MITTIAKTKPRVHLGLFGIALEETEVLHRIANRKRR
jgi:hypothetical protein